MRIETEIWYGFCTFWTDDWNKLAEIPTWGTGKAYTGGIPCCPECGSPGFQMTLQEWNDGIVKFNAKEPGYAKFINELKNTCHGRGVGLGDLWEKRQNEN